jgi:hypothetical protein
MDGKMTENIMDDNERTDTVIDAPAAAAAAAAAASAPTKQVRAHARKRGRPSGSRTRPKRPDPVDAAPSLVQRRKPAAEIVDKHAAIPSYVDDLNTLIRAHNGENPNAPWAEVVVGPAPASAIESALTPENVKEIYYLGLVIGLGQLGRGQENIDAAIRQLGPQIDALASSICQVSKKFNMAASRWVELVFCIAQAAGVTFAIAQLSKGE